MKVPKRLLGGLFVVGAFVVLAFLLSGRGNAEPIDMGVADVSHTGFTVAWFTPDPVIGEVHWAVNTTNPSTYTTTAESTPSTVHYIEVSTPYRVDNWTFYIVSDGTAYYDSDGDMNWTTGAPSATATTPWHLVPSSDSTPPPSYVVYGHVVNITGGDASGVVVGVGNTTTALFYSNVTDANGNFTITVQYNVSAGDELFVFIGGAEQGKNTSAVVATGSQPQDLGTFYLHGGPADYLVLTGFPVNVTAGDTFSGFVEVYDPWNNLCTEYNGKVTFATTDPQGSVSTDLTFSPSDGGNKSTNSFILETAGLQTITAYDASDPAVNGSVQVQVNPGPAYALTIEPASNQSSPIYAENGTAVTMWVNVTDQYGNPVSVSLNVRFSLYAFNVSTPSATIDGNSFPWVDTNYSGPSKSYTVVFYTGGYYWLNASNATIVNNGSSYWHIKEWGQPDIWVEGDVDDFYTDNLTGQLKWKFVNQSEVAVFNVTVQNDGNVDDIMLVIWTNYSYLPPGWTYWVTGENGTNMTQYIFDDPNNVTYVQLGPGEYFNYTVYILPAADAPFGENGAEVVFAYSYTAIVYNGLYLNDSGGTVGWVWPVDYIRITDNPNGAEIPDQTVGVGETYQGYASAYSNTIGYLGLVEVNWSADNYNGASAWNENTTLADNDTLHTGVTGGIVNWTARYHFVSFLGTEYWSNDSANFTVQPPTIDHINITDSPGGVDVPDQSIVVGSSVEGYASAYNNSIGYLGLVNATWTVTNTGTNAYTVNGTGENDTFYAGTQAPGVAVWTASYSDGNNTHTDTVTFAVEVGPLDYIVITPQHTYPDSLNVSAGTDVQFTVYGYDQYGNVNTSWGPPTVGTTDGRGTLGSVTWAVDHYVFNYTAQIAGYDNVTVDTPELPPSPDNISCLQIFPGPVTKIVMEPAGGTATAGVSFSLTIRYYDDFGNENTTATMDLNFTTNDTHPAEVDSNPLPHIFTGVQSGDIFMVTFYTAGYMYLNVTNTTGGLYDNQTWHVYPNQVYSIDLVPDGGVATAGATFFAQVYFYDQYGNENTTAVLDIQITSTDSSAVANGSSLPTTVSMTSGYSFDVTFYTTGDQQLTVTDTSNASLTDTSTFTVNPAALGYIAMDPAGGAVQPGGDFNLSVTVYDIYGNIKTDYTGTIVFNTSDSSATVDGNPADGYTYTYTSGAGGDNGSHVFSVVFNTPGSQWLNITDQTDPTVYDNETFSVATVDNLILITPTSPVNVSADVHQVTVVVFAWNRTYDMGVPGVPIDWAFYDSDGTPNSGGGTLTSGATTTTNDTGYATQVFDTGTFAGDGWYLTATDAYFNRTNQTPTITVVHGALAHLGITPAAGTTTAGTPINITVTAEDQYGNIIPEYNGTVHFTSTDPYPASLPSDYTYDPAVDGGSHLFTVTFYTAGFQTLTVADTSNGSISGSATWNVDPASPATLEMTPDTGDVTAGVDTSVTLTIYDAYDNVVTDYLGTVNFTSSDGYPAEVGGNPVPYQYTFTAADAGTHTFSVTFYTAGTQTITATDTGNASLTDTSTFTVAPAPASRLEMTPHGGNTGIGGTLYITVTAYDSYNNTATDYSGTVNFTSDDTTAVLPADYTFDPSTDNGSHTFMVVFNTAGTWYLNVTDIYNATLYDNATWTVLGPDKIEIVQPTIPIDVSADVNATTIQVTVWNTTANVTLAGVELSVSFADADATPNSGTGSLEVTATITDSTGNATFVFHPGTVAGDNWVVTITNTTYGVTNTTHVITVVPGAPAAFDLTPDTGTTTAGTNLTMTLTIYDAHGNVVTGYTGTVNFTSSDGYPAEVGGNPVPYQYTFTAADAGTHTFSVTFYTAGTQTITATDTGDTSLTDTSTYTVNPAELDHIVVEPASVNITADDMVDFNATGYDAYNNEIGGLVFVWSVNNSAAGTIDENGTFDAVLAGTWTINATNGSVSGYATVTVTPGAPVTLDLTPDGGTATAGVAITVTVTVYDSDGNTVTGYNGTVSLSSTDTAAVLPDSYTFDPSTDGGSHQFTVTFYTAGTWTLTASDINNTVLTDAETWTVEPGPLDHIVVEPASVNITADDMVDFNATGYDAYNNEIGGLVFVWSVNNSAAGTIDENGTFDAVLAGTWTINATNGSVSGYATVTVTPGAPVSMSVEGEGGVTQITADDTLQMQATVYDSDGNIISDAAVTWTASNGTITSDGLFTPWSAGEVTITASVDGLTVTVTVVVTPGAPASLEITPADATITADDTQQFTARVYDAKGNEITDLAVVWTASNGTITADGLFTPWSAGEIQITATAGDISSTVTITVAPGAPARVVVSPSEVDMTVGDTQQFTARVYDAKGNEITDATVTWTTDDSAGEITSDGFYTAGSAGNWTITATVDGASGTATANVRGGEEVTQPPTIGEKVKDYWWLLLLLIIIIIALLVILASKKGEEESEEEYMKEEEEGEEAGEEGSEEGELAMCPTCGAVIPADSKVCPECGEVFEVEEEEAAGEEAGEKAGGEEAGEEAGEKPAGEGGEGEKTAEEQAGGESGENP